MNSSNPCAIDDEKLIQAVESKELLFNKGHHFYKNVIQKEVAWRAIAEDCYASVDAVKKRWKILRDRFVRELRNYGKSKDDNGMVWERFEQLIFLRHHVNHKNALLPLEMGTIKIEDQHKNSLQPQQLSPQLLQQQPQSTLSMAAQNNAAAVAAAAAAAGSIGQSVNNTGGSGSAGIGGYDTPADNTVDTYDHTIKYMFSEDDGIQPEILEGDELLNEFLIRKKRDTSTSPTHSGNGGASGASGGAGAGAGAASGAARGINDAQLILAIRARHCLYEKGNANYKNITEKEKMWKQVADECAADSVRVVRSRWKQLRDRFGRELKSANPSRSGWKLFDEMIFIKDHVNVRSSMMNANEADGDKNEMEDNTDAADLVYVDGQRLNVPRMIALIKNQPVLYDKTHRHYHNEGRKDQAWESVAADLQLDETALKTQWQAIQEKYHRERKLAKKSNVISQWPLLDSLDFLKQSSKSQSKQHRSSDGAGDHHLQTTPPAIVIDASGLQNSNANAVVNNNANNNHNNQHLQHHQHVVIVSAPSADNPHSEVVATYSTNVGLDDGSGNIHNSMLGGAGSGMPMISSVSGGRKRRRDSGTILGGGSVADGLLDGGDCDDDDLMGASGSGLERKIESIVKRIVTRDGTGNHQHSSTAAGSTYEEEFFSKFICEKLKSFPKKLRADAKSHIFQYLHELDNTLQ